MPSRICGNQLRKVPSARVRRAKASRTTARFTIYRNDGCIAASTTDAGSSSGILRRRITPRRKIGRHSPHATVPGLDRKGYGVGKRWAVSVDHGGPRLNKKNKKKELR